MIKSILIVGGGTAGWMTAAYLSATFGEKIAITVVESSKVKKIGVGEATFSTIKHFFDYLGLDEATWLPECSGSYKLGIKYENWRGDGGHFYHPFERLESSQAFSLADWWLAGVYKEEQFDKACFMAHTLCEAKRSPRMSNDTLFTSGPDISLGRSTLDEQQSQFPYAYHFDADKVAEFLSRYAIQRGVRHIVDDVICANRSASDGWISEVVLKSNDALRADMYIDCTGFRGLLINGALGEPFESFSEFLPNNRAVALRTSREDLKNLSPFTTATAADAGWMWTIPLFERNGHGYVYSDSYCSPHDAEKSPRDAFAKNHDEIDVSHIEMRIGRNRNSWVGNCIAIGLSSAFVEPLESTGIFFIQHAIEQLVKHFPDTDWSEPTRTAYNKRIANAIDGVKEFLILHYVASPRMDNQYWIDTKVRKIPDGLAARLELARYQLLDDETMFPYYHGFESYSWNTILLGLGAGPIKSRPVLNHLEKHKAAEKFDALRSNALRLSLSLPSCYEYLANLQFGNRAP